MAEGTSAPDSVADLLSRLRQLQLVAPARLEELAADSRHGEPQALARTLLERGLLTHYQVNLLFQGRGAELLLDPYVVLARLGEGGSGLVLKARHTRMHRVVAIKLIRKSLLTDADVVARFQREIEVASQVSHPNVVHAFDAGPMNGTFGLVMEYVEGTDLARLIETHGPLAPARACAYVRQAALGMQHVHEKGLIHRDIKPSNLLVTQAREGEAGSGTVKVLDLGLARLSGHKAQTASSQLTTMGSVMMGTPDYMAPEQALDLRTADIRADVYSLGCTLFYLLTGQPPFPAASLAQKLLKHQQAPPPSVRRLRPELPEALDPILKRMLAKRPADRYQTPAEVAEALAPLAAADRRTAIRRSLAGTWTGKTARSLPQATGTLVPSSPAKLRRRRWLLPLGAALLLSVSLAVSWLAVSAWKRGAGLAESGATQSVEPQAPAPRPLAALTALGDPRGRHWGSVTAVAFSPDGKLLASAAQGATIHVWDAATLAEVRTLPIQSRHIGTLAFSPDGRRLAGCMTGPNFQSSDVKIWDVASGKELTGWSYPGSVGIGVAFSSDGATVALAHQAHIPPAGQAVVFRTWESATGKERRPPVEAANSWSGRLSANGAVGLSYGPTGWKYWDLAKGRSDLDGALVPNRGLLPHALSADGLTMSVVSQNPMVVNNTFTNELRLIHLGPLPADAPPAQRTQTHTLQEDFNAMLIAPGPRPNTVILWGRSLDGSKGAIRLWDASGTPKRLAQARLPSWVSALVVSPDGKTLAVASNDGNLRLWDAATLAERLPETGHSGGVQYLAFADGDRTLVSASAVDFTVRSWDHAAGKEKARLSLDSHDAGFNRMFGMNFTGSTDGSGLAVWNHQGLRWLDVGSNKHRDIPDAVKGGLQAMAVSPDGRTLAAVTGNSLKFWDTASGGARPGGVAQVVPVGPMVFSRNGQQLAFPGQVNDNGKISVTVRVLDVATGAERWALPGTFANISSWSLSADGRFLAASVMRLEGGRYQQEWKVWEVATGKERPLLPAPPPGHAVLLFASTGSNLAAWNPNRIEVWDAATGKSRYQLTIQPQNGRLVGIRALVFARDGQSLAYALNDGRVVLLDCASSTTVQEWKLPGPPNGLAISADGKQVAVGSPSGLIQVRRLRGTMTTR